MAQDWRPIETAPTDGTKILVCAPARDPRWVKIVAHAQHKFKGTPWKEGHPLGGSAHYPPTHWMPLPTPPAAVERPTSAAPTLTQGREP